MLFRARSIVAATLILSLCVSEMTASVFPRSVDQSSSNTHLFSGQAVTAPLQWWSQSKRYRFDQPLRRAATVAPMLFMTDWRIIGIVGVGLFIFRFLKKTFLKPPHRAPIELLSNVERPSHFEVLPPPTRETRWETEAMEVAEQIAQQFMDKGEVIGFEPIDQTMDMLSSNSNASRAVWLMADQGEMSLGRNIPWMIFTEKALETLKPKIVGVLVPIQIMSVVEAFINGSQEVTEKHITLALDTFYASENRLFREGYPACMAVLRHYKQWYDRENKSRDKVQIHIIPDYALEDAEAINVPKTVQQVEGLLRGQETPFFIAPFPAYSLALAELKKMNETRAGKRRKLSFMTFHSYDPNSQYRSFLDLVIQFLEEFNIEQSVLPIYEVKSIKFLGKRESASASKFPGGASRRWDGLTESLILWRSENGSSIQNLLNGESIKERMKLLNTSVPPAFMNLFKPQPNSDPKPIPPAEPHLRSAI